MPNPTTSKLEENVRNFVRAINTHDVLRLSSLMTDDHVLTDALGVEVRGRESVSAAWLSYFQMFPDYAITCEAVFVDGSLVGLFGRASGTYARSGNLKHEDHWCLPAAWRAVVHSGRIARWSVYCDSGPIAKIIASGDQASS